MLVRTSELTKGQTLVMYPTIGNTEIFSGHNIFYFTIEYTHKNLISKISFDYDFALVSYCVYLTRSTWFILLLFSCLFIFFVVKNFTH